MVSYSLKNQIQLKELQSGRKDAVARNVSV